MHKHYSKRGSIKINESFGTNYKKQGEITLLEPKEEITLKLNENKNY